MNPSQDETRIVLIGKTGNGKSSTGNSLLHSRTAFVASQSAQSITKACDMRRSSWADTTGRTRALMVVDTPGFFDTNGTVTNEMVERTIASQIFQMTSPGVHAFLIVLRIGRFTPEEKQTVDFIKKIFGTGAARYCLVVFTREDELDDGQTIDDFVHSSHELEELVRICGNRKFVINNRLSGKPLETKTNGLLRMIDQMVQSNNGDYYTNAEYQRIERQRREEQARREQQERERKQAYEAQLVAGARQEEQRKADERVKKTQEEAKAAEKRAQAELDEERRKNERRQQEDHRRHQEQDANLRRMREELSSASSRSSARSNDSDVLSLLAGMGQMGFGGGMSQRREEPCNYGMPFQQAAPSSYGMGGGMPSAQPRPSSGFTMTGGHNGRFTGDFMSTRGRANGQPIFEGGRGGQFYLNSNGNKSYLRR